MAGSPIELASATDQEVVALARHGQDAAYRELVRRYERPIFSLVYRMVRDRELAEDLAQETFVKALNAIESLPSRVQVFLLDLQDRQQCGHRPPPPARARHALARRFASC